MLWSLSHRFDKQILPIADRHYSRQKPGSPQFVPPGRCLVLKAHQALWVTSWPFGEYVKHAWPGAWVCSFFRNENRSILSSALIRDAIAATRWRWPDASVEMVTFVDPGKVRRKRDPGRCFLRAGFVNVGHTKGGLVALAIEPGVMPPAREPHGAQLSLSL